MYYLNKILKYAFFLFIQLLVLNNTISFGQGITLKAGVDSTHILIGDQVKLKFEVTQPKNVNITFPQFSDTIIDKIEIIETLNRDTTWLTNQEIRILQEYIITSFDSGFYLFPPFDFPIKSDFIDDTIQSKPFFMQVFLIPIDTTKGIFDIKTTYKTPFTFREALPIIIYSSVGIIIALLAIYIIVRIRKNKPVFKREKPKIPPHIIAFDELDKLKLEKLWQQGKVKEYYSRLTDIIRIYIEDRFYVRAMEYTTFETLNAFNKNKLIDSESLKELSDLLVQADFVKFAKASPLPDENEMHFQDAYNFVRRTKPISQIENNGNTDNNDSLILAETNNTDNKDV